MYRMAQARTHKDEPEAGVTADDPWGAQYCCSRSRIESHRSLRRGTGEGFECERVKQRQDLQGWNWDNAAALNGAPLRLLRSLAPVLFANGALARRSTKGDPSCAGGLLPAGTLRPHYLRHALNIVLFCSRKHTDV